MKAMRATAQLVWTKLTTRALIGFRRTASVSVTMMAIAVIGLVIPAVFAHAIEERSQLDIEYLSIGVAIALMIGYVLNLVFTFTARELRGVPGAPEETKHVKPGAHSSVAHAKGDDVAEHASWSIRRALVILAVSVIFIAALSEILVDAIEPLVRQQGLTELFVGVIVVPIIGNAAEHLVAVEMALKNKMEIALGIALGSSMQIALFVGREPVHHARRAVRGRPRSGAQHPTCKSRDPCNNDALHQRCVPTMHDSNVMM